MNPAVAGGLTPHQRQGFWRITDDLPAANTNVRVEGYGTDSTPAGSTGGRNAQSQTLQTALGPYLSETTSGQGYSSLTIRVDTEGGNSGSPIIWEANG